MDDKICPACRAANDSDASYCDQCGLAIDANPAEGPFPDGDDGAGGCPACGGPVQDHGDGSGVCRSCGLELAAKDAGAPAAHNAAELAKKLTAAILAKISGGAPHERAVSEACHEVVGGGARAAGAAPAAGAVDAPDAPVRACPVCGAQNAVHADRCAECEVWFAPRHKPGPCPSCGEETSGDRCKCGAALTVDAAAAALEPSVRFLCSVCKQPFVKSLDECPDCGGKLLSADRLRAYADARIPDDRG